MDFYLLLCPFCFWDQDLRQPMPALSWLKSWSSCLCLLDAAKPIFQILLDSRKQSSKFFHEFFFFQKKQLMDLRVGHGMHTCHPIVREREAAGLWRVWGQPWLRRESSGFQLGMCMETSSQKQKHTAKIRKSGGAFPLRRTQGKRSLTNAFRKFSAHAVRENSVVRFGNDQASAVPSTK